MINFCSFRNASSHFDVLGIFLDPISPNAREGWPRAVDFLVELLCFWWSNSARCRGWRPPACRISGQIWLDAEGGGPRAV